MAKQWGSARQGDDSDGNQRGPNDKVVVIENSYFEKLAGRLATAQRQPAPAAAPVAGDGGGSGGVVPTGEFEALPGAAPVAPAAPKSPGFTIYGDDGRPIK